MAAVNTGLRIALVGCGSRKGAVAAPAREIYVGSLFRAQLAHAEATADRVWILSARHGLLAPDTVIEPYEHRLSTRASGAAERDAWARRVAARLLAEIATLPRGTIAIYAGEAYAAPLARELRGVLTVDPDLPLAGMTQGRRLQWFAQQRRERAALTARSA